MKQVKYYSYNFIKTFNIILILTTSIICWRLLNYWTIYSDILLVIGIIVLIFKERDMSVSFLLRFLQSRYFSVKFYVVKEFNKKNKSNYKLLFYKIRLNLFYFLIMLFGSHRDSFVTLREDIFNLYTKIEKEEKGTRDKISKKAFDIITQLEKAKQVSIKDLELLQGLLFEFNKQRQVEITVFCLILILLLITFTVLLNFL